MSAKPTENAPLVDGNENYLIRPKKKYSKKNTLGGSIPGSIREDDIVPVTRRRATKKAKASSSIPLEQATQEYKRKDHKDAKLLLKHSATESAQQFKRPEKLDIEKLKRKLDRAKLTIETNLTSGNLHGSEPPFPPRLGLSGSNDLAHKHSSVSHFGEVVSPFSYNANEIARYVSLQTKTPSKEESIQESVQQMYDKFAAKVDNKELQSFIRQSSYPKQVRPGPEINSYQRSPFESKPSFVRKTALGVSELRLDASDFY